MKTLTYGPYTVELVTEETCRGIIYAVMDQQGIKETWHLLEGHNLALAAISGVDWNRELAPWKAPKAFRGSEDFGGQGPALLDTLTQQIIPLIESHLGYAPEFRGIAGYSLAGLFALWAPCPPLSDVCSLTVPEKQMPLRDTCFSLTPVRF